MDCPETMRKLCLSTKFPHQEIKWNYGIFRCVTNSFSIFKFERCLFLTVNMLESFKYEIPMYQNLSSN